MKTSATILITLALIAAMMLPTGAQTLSHAPGTAPPPPQLAALSSGLNAPLDIRVNAGGSDYTDTQGKLWLADRAYSAGSWGYTAGSSFVTTAAIANTDDDPLYQSQRSAPGEYKFDVANDVYEVELRFAEIYCSSPDCRRFNVWIEGVQLLTNLDPRTMGGFFLAFNVTFLVRVTDNQLRIQFVPGSAGTPVINAIRVTGTTGGPARNEVRLNAAGFDYRDSQSNLWISDQPYLTGTRGYQENPPGTSGTYQTTATISNTVEQTLFKSNRYNMSGYTFDIANGAYRVDLLLAEIYPSVNATGQRVFDVYAEGQKVLSDIDVFTRAGSKRNWAITETFNVNVLDAQLNITFTKKPTSTQPAIVNALAIKTLDSVPPGPWTNFAPTGWASTQTPAVSVQVQDTLSGLNVGSGQYRYSTNGGASYSAWLPASTTGVNGDTTPQTVSANVPFGQDSATQNKVQFRISDMGGNSSESGVYTVQVDSLPPVSTITSPTQGSFVSTPNLTVQGTATDAGAGVQSVEVSRDGGSSWEQATGATSWSRQVNLPGDGIYNLRSRARDVLGRVETPGAGVTVTLDTVPPVTFIRTPSPGQTITSTTFLITGTAFDATAGVQRVEISTDGGTTWVSATGTTSWFYNWTPSGQGNFTIRARAVDRGGNIDNPGTAVNVVVDRLAPTSTINDPQPGRYIRGDSYTISGVASDDPAGSGLNAVEVSTDGVNWDEATGLAVWLYEWDPLPPDGTYTLRSRARDNAGNVQNPPYSSAVTVDNTPPASTHTLAGTVGLAGWYISPVTVNILAVDATAGIKAVYHRLDGGDWITYTAPVVVTANGSRSFQYYAADRAGNNENTHQVSLLIDTVPPTTTATLSGAAGSSNWYRTAVQVTLSANDAASGLRTIFYNLDSSGWQVYSIPFTVSGEGTHTLLYYATDNAGNNESVRTQPINIDAVAPAAAITFPTAGQVISAATVIMSGNASDTGGSGLASVEVSVDGGAWTSVVGSTSWTYFWIPSGPGIHNLRVRANDVAGNSSNPGSGIYVTVDALRPTSAIVSPYNGQVVRGPTVVITGTAADEHSGVSHVDVSTNGGGTWGRAALISSSTWAFTWTIANDGIYNIRSRATDRGGNIELPGPGISVQVDSIAPTSLILDPTGGQYIRGASYTVRGTATDVGSGVKRIEVSIDNGPWNLADGMESWTYSWSPLGGDGPHTVRSRATDMAGNTESPGPGISVIVDNGKPTSTIIQPGDRQVITEPVVFISGTSSDAISPVKRVEVSMQRLVDGSYWNGMEWVAGETWLQTEGSVYDWNYTWAEVPRVGTVLLRSRATDNVGNVEIPGAGVRILFWRGYTINMPVIMSSLSQ